MVLIFPEILDYNNNRRGRDELMVEKKKLIPREILKQFIKENNLKTAEDAKDLVKELFADTIQELLEAEMDHSLGYEKNDATNKSTDNRRNGHTKKTVRSDYGEVELTIPRDRTGEFDPLIVKKHQKNVTGIEGQIIALYAKGVSTREIQGHLQHLYGIDISPVLISNITNKIVPLLKEWQNRPLQDVYAIAFLDAAAVQQ